MALSAIDRDLIQRCLAGDESAWRTFVDRFIGLVTYVVNHAAESRGMRLTSADREDAIADVFAEVLHNDMAVLRRFQGSSSLATYLAVVARRIATRRLMSRVGVTPLAEVAQAIPPQRDPAEQRIDNRDEVDQMLGGLEAREAQVVRLYHLEGKTYGEISRVVGMPENSIGPLLTRARGSLRRQAGVEGHPG